MPILSSRSWAKVAFRAINAVGDKFYENLTSSFAIIRTFKLVYDLVVLILSSHLLQVLSRNSYQCSNNELKTAFTFYFIVIVLPMYSNSLIEFIVYLHKFWKKLLISSLTCSMIEENENDNQKEKDSKALTTCFIFLIGIPLSLLYLTCYLFVSFLRVIDIRQCFWKKKNYYTYFIISYVFQMMVYFFAIGVLASFLSFQNVCSIESSTDPNLTDSSTNSSITLTLLIMIILRFVKRSIYLFGFQYFVPSGLGKAHDVINTNDSNQVFTIIGQNNSNHGIISIIERKHMLLFPEKYLFMPQFLRFMRISELGSMGCLASTNCTSLDLEHIVLCHNELNIPNEKCRCCYDCTSRKDFLIGFHQTDTESALCIAMSPMRPTKEEKSWFGSGIYFARCYADTHQKIGQEGGRGALIVALLNMKRVKHLKSKEDNTGNDPNFDSIYVPAKSQGQNKPSKDELLVYNANQIEQFIICI